MEKVIKLDDKWTIEADTYSWRLVFKEVRLKDKLDGQRNKTGEQEEYLFEDSWWYPKLGDCLKKFQEESVKPLSSIELILGKITEINDMVSRIKEIYCSNGKLIQP